MNASERIKNIYNTLFSKKDEKGNIVKRLATVGIVGIKPVTGPTGITANEKIIIPSMPIDPQARLPMEPGVYKSVDLLIYFDEDLKISISDIEITDSITLIDLFKEAKASGTISVLGENTSLKANDTVKTEEKTEEKQTTEDKNILEVVISTGETVRIAIYNDNYHIVGSDGRPIDPKSTDGKDAIKKYLKEKVAI